MSIIINIILAFGTLIPQPIQKWLTTSGRPQSHAVVLAKVKSVTEGRISDFVLEIEHVYGGDQSLLGTTVAGKRYEQGNAGVFTLHPAPQVGEAGIWLVPNSPEGGEVDAYTNRRMFYFIPLRFPARRLTIPGDDNYRQALEWAQAVETLESFASDAERLEQLKSFALGKDAMLSTWAINVLARLNPEIVRELSGRLLRPDVPLRGQLALDEAMAEIEREDWINSEQREMLLRRWLGAALNEADGSLILQRLSLAIQKRQIDPSRSLEFLSVIVRGPYPQPVQQQAIRAVRWIIDTPDVKDGSIALLSQVLLSEAEISLKFAAAQSLRNLRTVEPHQLKRLHMVDAYYAELVLDTEHENAKEIAQIAAMLNETVRKLDKSTSPQS